MYNAKQRKGAIYQKLVYSKRKTPKEQTEPITKHARQTHQNAPIEIDNLNDDSESEHFEGATFSELADAFITFIKNCIFPRDQAKIMKKFEETVALRKDMDLNQYKPLFDLYLLLPSLVR